MAEVISVKFNETGKSYFFDPAGFKINKGDGVIVETVKGTEYGICSEKNRTVDDSSLVKPLAKVIRPATPRDTRTYENNLRDAKRAMEICRQKIEYHGLDMTLVRAEYTFDRSKITFFYTAPTRVDFRELIKTLAVTFKIRIELRQINVREKAKMIGGMGICGRPVCCKTCLPRFQFISIKTAKELNLFHNTSKINGTCGKLMCCLKNELDSYTELSAITPKVGSVVMTPEGKGTVTDANLLSGNLKIALDKSPNYTTRYHRNDVKVISAPKKAAAPEIDLPEEVEPEE